MTDMRIFDPTNYWPGNEDALKAVEGSKEKL